MQELSVSCEPTELNHVDGAGFQTMHCSTDPNLVAKLEICLFAREHEGADRIHGNDVIRLQQKQDCAYLTCMLKPHPSKNAQVPIRYELPLLRNLWSDHLTAVRAA